MITWTGLISVVGIFGTLCGIGFGYVGYRKGLRTDYYESGVQQSTLKADMGYIKRRVDEMLLEQRDMIKSLSALAERVTRVEESAKQAHKRLNRLEGNADD